MAEPLEPDRLKLTMPNKNTKTTLRTMFATTCLIMLTMAFSAHVSSGQSNRLEQRYAPVKILGFSDPNTNHRYGVVSYNSTTMAASSNYRSIIRVTKTRIRDGLRVSDPEDVQTIKFHASLVDFDLQCIPTHCYLVAVTSSSRQNVELFAWHRTQFDLKARRDSFSRPFAVRLFRIQSGFYIVVAQEQLHLYPSKLYQDYDEPARFIGCAILKFVQGYPDKLKYHQFIRLPFNPLHIHYFASINSNNATALTVARPIENHHIVFSIAQNWVEAGPSLAHSYIWSPLDDYFWPYRIPRGGEIASRPPGGTVIHFPNTLPAPLGQNLSGPAQDYAGPVETCFHQLQRLLADRDIQARQLLATSKSIWRLNQAYGPTLTNISAQVIVHGNVTVLGSLIESPQISLIAGHSSPFVDPPSNRKVSHLINTHSPAIVENKFKQAMFKLEHMRQKLSRAVLANLQPQSVSVLNNQVRFFGNIEAREVLFKGIDNSNVRINGIPFGQLQHELVSLNGVQDIGTKVVFDGRVVADRLEIHGSINDYYYLKDAIDITSRHVQIIDASGRNTAPAVPGLSAFEFKSISTPQVMLAPNATFNTIRLNDFITRDNKTQLVFGRKSFKRLSAGKLDLAHPDVLLNNFNLFHLARNAIHLRNIDGKPYQTISGQPVTFMRGVQVKRLVLNNMINRHINLTSLIHDSVKSDDARLQQIYGQKNFLNSLQINRLTTEGALNGIEVGQIFNLNPASPSAEYHHSGGALSAPTPDSPISGEFRFKAPVIVQGNLNTGLVNGIDLSRRAVRRIPPGQRLNSSAPQLVRGHKIFYKPLRIMSGLRLMDHQEARSLLRSNTSIPYPLVNNIDLRLITSGLMLQKQRPSLINVDDLEIDGNLNLPSSLDRNGPPRITLGNYSLCPLDLIPRRLVLASAEHQTIEAPIRVNSLRAKAVVLEDGTLNGLKLPGDFVLRSSGSNDRVTTEPVFGTKFIDHLIISPPNAVPKYGHHAGKPDGIIFDRGVNINRVDHSALQTFIQHERQHNSTGKKVFNTINVYGNLYSSRLNGYRWPDDILLRSVSSQPGRSISPHQHKRIYSHLLFLNSSNLNVINQLVLRGPVQLNGRVNGVNLTDFARHSATYGDKDLYSIGRPIRNKLFLGGITVKSDIRSQGLIDGVNFDEMKRRVVSVNQNRERTVITSPKMFMSDATFQSPTSINYLGDVPMERYLRKIQFQPDGKTLRVFGKKSITGALRINRNLFVNGPINGVDFIELQARAISLAPSDELTFNKTLTVEGDVFMDNLWIDERNGTIDGVKLKNLLPVGTIGKNELVLGAPQVDRRADPFGRLLTISGSFLDCQVSCNLQQPQLQAQMQPGNQSYPTHQPAQFQPQHVAPVVYPAQSIMAYTSRPAFVGPRNFTLTRTTPPYSMASTYQPPHPSYQGAMLHPIKRETVYPAQQAQMSSLIQRTPIAINYERKEATPRGFLMPDKNAIVSNHLDTLRHQIISINMFRLSSTSDIVAGFIAAATNDVSNYELPEEELSHWDHDIKRQSYLQLDQIDFPYNLPTIYHLSVGVATNQFGQNITSVFSSLGDINNQLSVLPVEFPNSAMFLKIPEHNTLFLLISQDYSINTGMCATGSVIANQLVDINQPLYRDASSRRAESGIHVYLFIALQNSSSLTSAYFDLYQTIDLPGIDSFEKFTYHGSAYVLAISRSVGRVYLMLLRGYSGFQIVSHIDTPMVEKVTVMFTQDHKPVLVVHQTSGLHRLMESVII